MNTVANTERPKLKLNFGAKPLTLNTKASPLVTGPAIKKVVVFEKPKESITAVGNTPVASDKTKASTTVTKGSSKAKKKSKGQELAANQKVVELLQKS